MQGKFYTFLVLLITNFVQAQAPDTAWTKCFGGASYESAKAVKPTADGGFIVIGSTSSFDGDIEGIHGGTDVWVLKLDEDGEIEWQKCLGGNATDEGYDIVQLADESYVLVGNSNSNDGDVSGVHEVFQDGWIVKLSADGELVWQTAIGGNYIEYFYGIAFSLNSFIVVGHSFSTDEFISGSHGGGDVFVAVVGLSGELINYYLIGGSQGDVGYAITATNDQGFIIAGQTGSSDGDIPSFIGESDILLVKLDYTGQLQWTKTLGGTGMDRARSIIKTQDGGYLMLGETASNDVDVSGNQGLYDCWIVKLSQLGVIEWKQCYGGLSYDGCFAAIQLSDGSYVTANEIYSPEVPGFRTPHGGTDCVLKAFSSTGVPTWENWYGGSGLERPYCIKAMNDSSWIMVGETNSLNGDVIGNHGNDDFWVVKFGNAESPTQISNIENDNITLFPQPANDSFTIATGSLTEKCTYQIYNISGELLEKGNIASDISINTSLLKQGIYFLQISGQQTSFNKAFTVIH